MKHLYPKIKQGPNRGEYEPPQGRLTATYVELQTAGCIQAKAGADYFLRIMAGTYCNPCNGCPIWTQDGPDCKAFQAYHTDWQIRKRDHQKELEAATKPNNSEVSPEFQGLNLKQIAAKVGVSLNKARQLKREGRGVWMKNTTVTKGDEG